MGALLALAVCVSARAADSGEYVEHRLQIGDTLETLSAQYLGTPRLWQRLQEYNHVSDPHRLQPGSVLRIPFSLLPLGSAHVSFVQGDARVLLPGATETVALQAGQELPEGARVLVPADGFINVRLSDGSMIRVQANSDVRLQQLRRRGKTGAAQSVLELQRGGVESTVTTSQDAARRFEVRTPMASTSVRGTRFSVSLDAEGHTLTAVTEGQVAVDQRNAAEHPARALVNKGQGLSVTADGAVGEPRSLLPAPDLSALPDTVSDADFLTLTLATPVTGAVAYQVQVARDADFTEVLRSGSSTTQTLRLLAVDDGRYQVSVRALDAAGLPGWPAQRAITVKAHPVPPLYQSPPAGALISRTQGALTCSHVVGVARYRIQAAADASFAALLIDATTESCDARVDALAPGQYQWRAASIRTLPGGAPDQGPFAPPQAFTVADNPAALSSNALNPVGDDPGLRLRWPGEPGQSFRLQLSASEDFATLLVDDLLNTPAWSTSDLAPGDYFVRIQTRDPSGLASEFSTPRRVTAQAEVRSGTGIPITSSDGRPLSRQRP
jgi:hypothetical protein